jgi:hypothetical protein
MTSISSASQRRHILISLALGRSRPTLASPSPLFRSKPAGPDKGMALQILSIPALLADEHNLGVRRAFS